MRVFRKKKLTAFLLACVLIFGSLSGCNKKGEFVNSNNYVAAENDYISSNVIATDGNLILEWDSDRLALLLRRDGELLWCSMPCEQYEFNKSEGAAKKNLESHLILKYIDAFSQQTVSVNSYSGVNEKGSLTTKLIDNGIRITYFFEEEEISIPIEYRLSNGAFEASVITEAICENENLVYAITLLPYAASLQNSDNNSIFVPDGSGMLMYCGTQGASRTYKASLYGGDLAKEDKYSYLNTQNIRLPCYGCSKGNNTLFTIISEGAPAAVLTATAGDKNLGYSYVNTTFNIRGKDTVSLRAASGAKQLVDKFTEKMCLYERMTLRMCWFTSENQAPYNDMAMCYRSYLIDEMGLKQEPADTPLVALEIPMAAEVKENVLGVSASVSIPIHTYSYAESIIESLKADGLSVAVRLKGIQKDGLGIQKIAGGFKLDKTLGNEKELKSLIDIAEDKGVYLYPDFDVLRFRKGILGFSKTDCATRLTTTGVAYRYFFNVDSKTVNSTFPQFMLLSPSYYTKAILRLTELLKENKFNNVSLSGFGSMFYSDYGDREQYLGYGYDKSLTDSFKILNESNIGIMTEAANVTAAVNSDVIIHAPTGTSEYYYEGEWVPFYQMVFKGYTPMLSEPINLARNGRRDFLRAIQCGIGLTYFVGSTDTEKYVSTPYADLSAGSFSDNRELIETDIKEASEILLKLQGTTIANFVKVDNNLYTTVFSNGMSVTINYSDDDYRLSDGTVIRAKGFVYAEE